MNEPTITITIKELSNLTAYGHPGHIYQDGDGVMWCCVRHFQYRRLSDGKTPMEIKNETPKPPTQ